jgi:DNA-directed RNA polymerase specialized sigma24 family protein
MTLMARDLQREPSLGWTRVEADEEFRRWMRTIMSRHCRESLRRLRRMRERESHLGGEEPMIETIPQLDLRLDLGSALTTLSQIEGTVVNQRVVGSSFSQIAETTGLRYQTVFSIWRRAKTQLRRVLKRGEWS